MHELLHGIVDVKSLKESKELKNSIEDDNKRVSVNSAKFRAAAQNVDYPAFAALVSCAHLKPMVRKELDKQMNDPKHIKCNLTPPAWSFDPRGKESTSLSDHGIQSNHEASSALSSVPNNGKPGFPLRKIHESHNSGEEINLSCFKNPLFEKYGSKNGISCGSGKSAKANPVVTQWCKSKFSSSRLDDIVKQRWKDLDHQSESPRLEGCKQEYIGQYGCQDYNAYTSDTFIKEWRRRMTQGNIKCLEFISFLPPDVFPVIFKVEIPPFLLKEILETLAVSISTLENEKDAKQKLNPRLFDNFQLDAEKCKQIVLRLINHLSEESRTKLDFEVSSFAEFVLLSKRNELNDIQSNCWQAIWIASILEALALCGRFGLSIRLAGQKTHGNVIMLLNFLHKSILSYC